MKTAPFAKEFAMGLTAVSEAMKWTRRIQDEFLQPHTLTKVDRSPVTIADFVSQAIVCDILTKTEQPLPIVGEEDSAPLLLPQNQAVGDKVQHFLSLYLPKQKKEDVFALIDRGKAMPADLFWTLDPIDGTKGFLRGGQYAIALALIAGGQVEIGIMGCPQLTSLAGKSSAAGFVLCAQRGRGSRIHNVGTLRVSPNAQPGGLRLLESLESAHCNHDLQEKIAARLGSATQRQRMDSQVKYAIVAGGDADVYLRIPHPDTLHYKENIWDHAAGALIVNEAGGRVTDMNGDALDFSSGKRLQYNYGILVSNGRVHDQVLTAYLEMIKAIPTS
jgi:3'(2'), 5'-bisphosphate nucleotidase